MVSASPKKQSLQSLASMYIHVCVCVRPYVNSYIYIYMTIYLTKLRSAGTTSTCFMLTHSTISKIHVMTLDEDILRREASGPWHKPSSHLLRFQHNPTVGRSTWPIFFGSWWWESLQSKALCLFTRETIWIKSAISPGTRISNFQKVAFIFQRWESISHHT